jgi:hypothetical protein
VLGLILSQDIGYPDGEFWWFGFPHCFQCQNSALIRTQLRFLPKPFQIMSPYHSVLYSPDTDSTTKTLPPNNNGNGND